MIIDFHTHIFPENLIDRAMEVLIKNSGNIAPQIRATVSGLTGYMDQHGLDRSVVLNIATNPKQQTNVNNFAAQINSERIIAFGSVYPKAENAIDELYRIKELGLKGIKFHPDYQDFYVDDPSVAKIYETAAALGLIVVFHAGVDIMYYEPVRCTPKRLAAALPAFKGGTVVAAHLGGYLQLYEVEEHLVGKRIYLDTSFSYSRVPSPHANRIIKSHGADKILFGSDMPWSGSHLEKRFIESMELDPEEYHAIMYKNAASILKLNI